MVSIDVPACLEAKELFLREAVEEYYGKPVLKEILREPGSVSEVLFNKGKERGYYTGDFNPKEVPQRTVKDQRLITAYYNDKKTLQADSEFLGHLSFNKNGLEVKGPFSYHANWFNVPWRVRSWDMRIEDNKSHYVSCNPTRIPKALLWLFREMTSDMLDHIFREMEELWVGISKRDDRYADIFDFSFKNPVFKGETLSADVESASNKKTKEYPVTYKNPLTIEEFIKEDDSSLEIRFPGNLTASCGCDDCEKGIKTKDEPYVVNSWCKHLTALILDAKYDITKKISTYRPKSERREGGLGELLTFYSPLERPWIPGSKNEGNINKTDNPIFKQINAHILQEYYVNKKTMRQIDFELFNQYGFEIIIDPLLHIKLMCKMLNLRIMKENTAFLTGNVKGGWLEKDGKRLLRGNKRLGISPVYDTQPIAQTNRIETPLPQGLIDVTDDSTMRKAIISIHPFRHDYLFWLLKNEKDDPAYNPRSSYYEPELDSKNPNYDPKKKPDVFKILKKRIKIA